MTAEEGGKEAIAQSDVMGNNLQYQERRVEASRVDQGLDFSQGDGKRIFLGNGCGFIEAW